MSVFPSAQPQGVISFVTSAMSWVRQVATSPVKAAQTWAMRDRQDQFDADEDAMDEDEGEPRVQCANQ